MSRIGNAPIPVPDGVTVTIEPARVAVAGPLGTLQQQVPGADEDRAARRRGRRRRPTERGEDRALHGLTRTLVANMVQGVTQGFEKKLEIQGVGYRAALKGTDLELSVGYSHTGHDQAAHRHHLRGADADEIFVKGTDKQMVGQTAAEIRKVRPPEPYKGKGIRYEGEYVAGRSASVPSLTVRDARLRRHRRVRAKVRGTAERPRLVVFRSNRGIEAQLVDDDAGRTLASASHLALAKSFKGDKTAQAEAVGKALAAAAKKAGVDTCVFDRGGYLYHGRVKALADGAREGGLEF
jgi:large subunit ribosomal protein L6